MKPLQAQVAGTSRKIVDFHLDETFDWVAELECGHQQLVRHNPPWTRTPCCHIWSLSHLTQLWSMSASAIPRSLKASASSAFIQFLSIQR